MASFLIDECVPRAVHEAVATLGHQIVLVRDVAPGVDDEDVLRLAQSDGHALITEDRRFGLLAISALAPTSGVLILALANASPLEKAKRVIAVLPTLIDSLAGSVVVIGPSTVRRRPL